MSSGQPEGTADAADHHAPLGEQSRPAPQAAAENAGGRQGHRGVLDVELQCGVAFPDGRLCGAALTCKRHSMSAKRAVAGRSAPYDALLAAYQAERRARAADNNA